MVLLGPGARVDGAGAVTRLAGGRVGCVVVAAGTGRGDGLAVAAGVVAATVGVEAARVGADEPQPVTRTSARSALQVTGRDIEPTTEP